MRLTRRSTLALTLGALGSGSPIVGAPAQVGPAALPRAKRAVAVAAHRGGGGEAAENTLSAIRHAVRVGADYVELDVRPTRDGVLVLMHDRTVDRTTGGKGAVEELTCEDIARLRVRNEAGAGDRVPRFEQALELCRGRINLYLDHKAGSVAALLQALVAASMTQSVVVYAGIETLLEWKRLAPGIPVMPSLPRENRVQGGISRFMRRLPAEVLDGHQLEWTRDLVADAHRCGAQVFVDGLGPVDNEAGWRSALEMGVDGIQSDFPGRLVRFLDASGPDLSRMGAS